VRAFLRTLVAVAVIIALSVSGVAACTGDAQTDHARMACCKAMHQTCAKRASVHNCCKTERSGHQTMASPAPVTASKMVAPHAAAIASALALASTASASRVEFGSATAVQHKPHSPPYLHHLVLLI